MTLWWERRLQGGRNSGRVGREDEAAAPARRARREPASDRARSDRPSAGPRTRARPAASAPRPEPTSISAANCRRRNSSGASFAARSSGSGMSTSGASRGAYSAGSRPISRKRVLEVGEALVGGLIRAEALAAPFGDRVQRRILQQLRRRPFDPGVRRLAEPRAKLLDEARLADAGFADDRARAGPRLSRARSQRRRKRSSSSSRPTSGVSARAPKRRPPLARTMRKSVDRLGHALERRARPCSSATNSPATWRCTFDGDQHRARLGERLHARGDIGRVAEHFAGRVDHDRPRLEADARDELRARPCRRSWR